MRYLDGYIDSSVGRPPLDPEVGKSYEMETWSGSIERGRCEDIFNQSVVFTDLETGKRYSCYLADFKTMKEI